MLYITRGHIYHNKTLYHFVKNKYDPKFQFGERLRQLRKELGLSQEALAYKAGLDRSYVGAVERGECNISLINICILADTLSVPPYQLLMFSANTKKKVSKK